MAIQLDKMTDKGVIANYWKVDSFNLSKNGTGADSVIINYNVSGYVNKQARDNGSKPLQSIRFTVNGDPNDPHLIVYPSLNLNWNMGQLYCEFSGYDTFMIPTHTVPILDLCNQVIGYTYIDAMTKDFSAGTKVD